MKSKNGWKNIPLGFKFLFVFICLGLAFTPFTLLGIVTTGTSFFGIMVHGVMALLIGIILSIIAPVILLVALLKKYNWTWKYGVAVYTFGTINTLGTLLNLDALVAPAAGGELVTFMKIMMIMMIMVSAGFNLMLAILFYVFRKKLQ